MESHGTSGENYSTSITELRERQRETDRKVEIFGTKLNSISADMGEMRALLQTAIKGQEGVFNRLNRPVGPLVLAAISLTAIVISTLAAFITLTISPVKENLHREIEHSEKVSFYFEERINEVERQAAVSQRDRYWVEKMSDRNNDQIDQLWYQLKETSEHTCRMAESCGK